MAVWLSSEVSCSTSVSFPSPKYIHLCCFASSTQKILAHARLAQQGLMARDPMKEAIGLELDMINILYVPVIFFPSLHTVKLPLSSIRIVQILSMNNNRK